MAYKQIHEHIWKDEWFLDLEPSEKLLFIYLFSNDDANLVGLYKISMRVIEFETGLNHDTILAILKRFSESNKVFYQDGYVWVVNLLKYNYNRSPTIFARIKYELSTIPDIELKRRCISGINTFLIPYGYRIDGGSALTIHNIAKHNIAEQDIAEQVDDTVPAAVNPNGKKAAAASSAALNSFQDVSARDAEHVYTAITGQPSIPNDQIDSVVSFLIPIIASYTDPKKMHDDGLRHFVRWCNTRGKNGRLYSRTNTGWLAWWNEAIAPNPGAQEQEQTERFGALCSKGEALKHKAEDLGDRYHEQAVLDFRKHVDTCNLCGGKTVNAAPMPDAVRDKIRQTLSKMEVKRETGS